MSVIALHISFKPAGEPLAVWVHATTFNFVEESFTTAGIVGFVMGLCLPAYSLINNICGNTLFSSEHIIWWAICIKLVHILCFLAYQPDALRDYPPTPKYQGSSFCHFLSLFSGIRCFWTLRSVYVVCAILGVAQPAICLSRSTNGSHWIGTALYFPI